MSCNCAQCNKTLNDSNEQLYMYRNRKGKSVFTGFVQQNGNIIWIGKQENEYRPIVKDDDRQFFLKKMRQYDLV